MKLACILATVAALGLAVPASAQTYGDSRYESGFQTAGYYGGWWGGGDYYYDDYDRPRRFRYRDRGW
jgi:hypothetical protein